MNPFWRKPARSHRVNPDSPEETNLDSKRPQKTVKSRESVLILAFGTLRGMVSVRRTISFAPACSAQAWTIVPPPRTGKPVARRGRKAMGPASFSLRAGLPGYRRGERNLVVFRCVSEPHETYRKPVRSDEVCTTCPPISVHHRQPPECFGRRRTISAPASTRFTATQLLS